MELSNITVADQCYKTEVQRDFRFNSDYVIEPTFGSISTAYNKGAYTAIRTNVAVL